ncbi:lysine-sensitive aspartokinase 3 [Vibrio halioticoli]|uniref:Aspartokinase n=2 Tax=Vibrio halioticoli TaxID=71388 RepID=V5FRK8_9VIBR|nr:lysine-sensitive aspartokinase 3 [Vibrio halioticoli]MPW37994.1 lysine-sensitive aspartokinase 3 [Vibrio sp. B1Z05]GAD91282.1 lysine-sensitive aspartokinase [Vibrio halioticoli NBRC 102217]
MSAINVAKFGGTSVANFEAMSRCVTIVENNPQTKLVVISACSGVTNILVELANGVTEQTKREQLLQTLVDIHFSIINQLKHPEKINNEINEILTKISQCAERAVSEPSEQLTDQLVSCGELMSTHILCQLMCEKGHNAQRFDIRTVMKTTSVFGNAEPLLDEISIAVQTHLAPLCKESIVVTQGFIGSDLNNKTTTLGRGGSDYSAALIAEAISASGLEIWTDVPGIYTTDPRIAPQAHPIKEISFAEASEMANFGAKILHPSTLVPALRHKIPVFVGSSKEPQLGGTWVKQEVESAPLFRAVTLRGNQTMITLKSLNMFQASGFLAKVFTILAQHKVSVDLITTSEISVSLTLDHTNTQGGSPKLPPAAQQELEKLCSVVVEHNLSLVALIGNEMGQAKGAAKQIFGTLEDYNLRMICYGASCHNLCFLLHESYARNAVQHLHRELFEG